MARRPLWIVVVLLLGAAAALWGAGGVGWGRDTGPGFTAVALLALASVAGVFAVSGWTRRLLGGIVVLAGAWVCWVALTADGAVDLLGGRGLAVLGGALFLAAGVLTAVYARTLPTMGTRYQLANAERRSGDPHKDMWDGLSDGEDPTADGPRT
jgi:hypothetical protein